MTAVDYVGLVLAGTPWWAYAVLALLVFLGVRRLKARVRSLGLALVAPGAFLVWGLSNVMAYSQAHSLMVGGSILSVLFLVGWASTRLYSDETAELAGDGRFLFHATPEPLLTRSGWGLNRPPRLWPAALRSASPHSWPGAPPNGLLCCSRRADGRSPRG